MEVLSTTRNIIVAVVCQLEGTPRRKFVDGEANGVDGFESVAANRRQWIGRDLPYLIVGWDIVSEAEQCQVEGVPG